MHSLCILDMAQDQDESSQLLLPSTIWTLILWRFKPSQTLLQVVSVMAFYHSDRNITKMEKRWQPPVTGETAWLLYRGNELSPTDLKKQAQATQCNKYTKSDTYMQNTINSLQCGISKCHLIMEIFFWASFQKFSSYNRGSLLGVSFFLDLPTSVTTFTF